ncbi:Clp protease N-terminal domain-containing protein [Streptomyces sp. NPDC002004]
MFERFTKDARAVVEGAVEHAERGGGDFVDVDHMLLALLDRQGSPAAFALSTLGLAGRRASVEHALAEARRRGGLSRAEMDALAGLGIDVEGIVARVEDVHGAGALASRGASARGRGRRPGRRPFTPGAKELLTRSLRIAVAQRDRHIGDEHLLLALTARPGVTAEILADHGVTHEAVQRVLHGVGGAGEARAS